MDRSTAKSDDGPEEGDTIHVTMEVGPPKFYAAIPEAARRKINATSEYMDYEKGEQVDKIVVEGEMEVTDTYTKDL